MDNRDRIIRLREEMMLPRADLTELLTSMSKEDEEFLYAQARDVRESVYGKDVYIRGLIEFTNYCRKDCLYCGIRASNKDCDRYRLTKEQIMECAQIGYELGFRTFVLQGGEDMTFTDEEMCAIISGLRKGWPDCAITLSIGERERESYEAYFAAGANRFLLRHESVTPDHYAGLHGGKLSIDTRLKCLKDLKDIGFQTGCGIMIGSPGQTVEHLVNDLVFMKEFGPQMVGMGPFVPHARTPFRDEPAGSLEDTLHMLGIVRLMMPDVLLPATTALGTIIPTGRELGLLAGANVVMPNLSPKQFRSKYTLYNGKPATGEEAAESVEKLRAKVESTGYRVVTARGDHAGT